MRSPRKTTIGVEVDRALRDKLKQLADGEARKLSAYVRLVLEQHVSRKLRRKAA